jgi:hypothetical protein
VVVTTGVVAVGVDGKGARIAAAAGLGVGLTAAGLGAAGLGAELGQGG